MILELAMAQKRSSDAEETRNRAAPVNGSARTLLRRGKDCAYDDELRRLQIELVKLQEWIRHKVLKLVVVFEGRDAAGKGGAIKRITQSLNPRVCRVVALGTPHRAGKDAVVLPAVCGAFAGGRRNGPVRPQLVQPGWR
jgi:polyphosphate kinase 2 (PPK2 family)